MTTTSTNWFSAISLKLAALDDSWPSTLDCKQSLFNMQLRVVAFAYHREEFTRLHLEAISDDSPTMQDPLVQLVPPCNAEESLTLNAALAAAQVLAATQSLYVACETLFRVFHCAAQLPGCEANARTSSQAYEQLRGCSAYQYLHGFVNLCDQQNLLVVRPRQSLLGRYTKRELAILDFHHQIDQAVCSFAQKWASDFLYRDCEQLIVGCNVLGESLANEIVV